MRILANQKGFFLTLTIVVALLIGGTCDAFAQKGKNAEKVPAYKTIPSASFLTLHAEYLGGYRPDQFFNPQVPAFGFKAGTMRNVGWFVGAMTNFNFKGTFVTCEPDEIIEDITSSSYFEALAGITLRYWHPLSFHLGLGYTYRSFNNQTIYGQWGHLPNHIAQGPMLTAGLMFHLGGFVVSAEAVGAYNVQGIKYSDYPVDKSRAIFGAKVGLGICIPYKYRSDYTPRSQQAAAPAPYVAPAPAPVPVPAPVEQPVEPVKANVVTPQPAPVQTTPDQTVTVTTEPVAKASAVKEAATLTVSTLPVTQLNPGWLTVCGEVTGDGIEPVTERGICWGTTPYPTLTGAHTSDGSGDGFFTTVIPDLQPGTIYYFRAYAGTRSEVRYGNTISVNLPELSKQSATPQPSVTPSEPQPPMAPPAPQTNPTDGE